MVQDTRMAFTEMPLAEARTDGLMRISQAIETAATLDELLLLSLHELSQLFEIDRSGVMLLDDNGVGQLVCEYPTPAALPPSMPLTDIPVLRRALRKRQPIQLHDIERYS